MYGLRKKLFITLVAIAAPVMSYAADDRESFQNLQQVLENLYDTMMPMCSQLIGVSRGIAGFGALWYIAFRVWRHLANAEPIDFYPLFRPFVLGFVIGIFPAFLTLFNTVLRPFETGTKAMVTDSNKAVAALLKQKDAELKKSTVWQMYVGLNREGDKDKWYKYTHDGADPKDQTWYESIGNDVRFSLSKYAYNFKTSIKAALSEILQIVFEGASLLINTLRTFHLIVLAIIGPMVFGIAVFDGLQQSLGAWIAKYINIFLWVPVANVFGAMIGKIQEQLIKLDIGQIQQTGDTFFSPADTGHIIFLIIGIFGYLTVPSIATFIVNAGSGDALTKKVSDAVADKGNMAIANMRKEMGGKSSK